MSTRDGKAYATGLYTGKKTIVKAGGKVSRTFKGKRNAREYRENSEYVDENGNILKDCVFSSPSNAAQFVNGNISNGLRVWKVEGIPLGTYLKEVNN